MQSLLKQSFSCGGMLCSHASRSGNLVNPDVSLKQQPTPILELSTLLPAGFVSVRGGYVHARGMHICCWGPHWKRACARVTSHKIFPVFIESVWGESAWLKTWETP